MVRRCLYMELLILGNVWMSGMSWSASFINSSLKICCIGVVADRALFLMVLTNLTVVSLLGGWS